MYSTNSGLPLRISLGGAALNTAAAAALSAGTAKNIVLGTNSGVVQYQTLRVNAGLADQEDVIVTAVNGDGATVTVAKLRASHAAGSTWTNLTDAAWTVSNSIFYPSDIEANLGNFIYSDCKSENNSIHLAYTASYWKGCSGGAYDTAILLGGWCTGVADSNGCQQILNNGGNSWLIFYPGVSATTGTGVIAFGGTNSNIAGDIISQGASPVRVNYATNYSASLGTVGTGGFQVGNGSTGGGLLGGLDSTGLYFGCAGSTSWPCGNKAAGHLHGTTSSWNNGGSAIPANTCVAGPSVSITGLTSVMGLIVTPAANPGIGLTWSNPYVSTGTTAQVVVCNVTTGAIIPAATSYGVDVIIQ
jgi:hypothetical protein